MKKLILSLIISLSLFSFNSNAQVKIGLSAGASIVDLVHAGVDIFPTPQSHFRFGIGTHPMLGEMAETRLRTLSFEGFYHFGWNPRHGTVKPLYVRVGINDMRLWGDERFNWYSFVYLSLGYDFNFTEHFGANAGLGLHRLLFEKIYWTDSSVEESLEYYNGLFSVIPRVELEFYYRF